MKKYQKIILAISIVISFTVVICLAAVSPDVRAAFNNVVNEEAYENLKEDALKIVNNSEAEVDESIHVNKQLKEDVLIVDVCKDYLYGIEIYIPISNANWKVEDSVLKCIMNIDFENMIYSEYKNINSKAFYIIFGLVLSFILSYALYGMINAGYTTIIKERKN